MRNRETDQGTVFFMFVSIFLLFIMGIVYALDRSWTHNIERNTDYQYVVRWISDASMRVEDFQVLNYAKGRSEFREINSLDVKDNFKNEEIKVIFNEYKFSFSVNKQIIFDSAWIAKECRGGVNYHMNESMKPLFEKLITNIETRDINLTVPSAANVDATIKHKNTTIELKNI